MLNKKYVQLILLVCFVSICSTGFPGNENQATANDVSPTTHSVSDIDTDVSTDDVQESISIKPPDSDSPASGICPRAIDEIVEITMTMDGPAIPRCVQVVGNQKLKFINARTSDVQINFAHFNINISAGGYALLDQGVAEYLASGVHSVSSAGVEIIVIGGTP